MASDSLKQVGKYIGKTGKDADRALKRVSPIRPRLERIRDVFDSTTAFEMSFVKDGQDNRVMLDLFFNLPPPIRGCKAGCIFTKCEEFDFASGGNHYVTITNPYLAGTVSVFVNNTKLSAAQIHESNPAAGEVFFQGTGGPDTVVICYVYTDCITNGLCPSLAPTLVGAQLLFSDNFNRIPSLVPYGGLGYWYNNNAPTGSSIDILHTPVIPINWFSGALDPGLNQYLFQEIHAAGPYFEVVIAGTVDTRLTFSPTIQGNFPSFSTSTFQPLNAPEPFISVEPNINGIQIILSAPYSYYQPPDLVTELFANYSQIYSVPGVLVFNEDFDPAAPIFIRYLYDGIYRAKVWLQTDPEPDSWVELQGFTPLDPSEVNITYPVISNYVGGSFGTGSDTSNTRITGISHWGVMDGNFHAWNHYGEVSNTWTRNDCEDSSNFVKNTLNPAGGVYFDGCNPPTDTMTESGTFIAYSHLGRLDTDFPSYKMRGVMAVFNEGGSAPPNVINYSGFDQKVVSFTSDIGKTPYANITGEVQWYMTCTTSIPPPNLTLALQNFTYGNNQPGKDGRFIASSETMQSISASRDVWYPFDIVLTSTDHDQYQWGVIIEDDPATYFAGLGTITDTGEFGLRTCPVYVRFQNIKVKTTVEPVIGALPFCPTHDNLSDRCPPFSDGLVGPTFDYQCPSITATTSFQSTSGQYWTLVQEAGAKAEFNNSFKSSFRARGITLDASDGRCAMRNPTLRTATRSRTESSNKIFTISPASCGNYSITLQFRFGTIGNVWQSTVSPFNTLQPSAELYISGGSFSDYVGILITKDTPAFTYIETDNDQYYGNSILENVLYNFRMDITDVQRIKIWRTSDPEPSAWTIQGPTLFSSDTSIEIEVDYLDYIDDNFTMEVFNPMVVAI